MNYRNLNVVDFGHFIGEKGVQLLDVRTLEEYSAEHLAGAENVNWFGKDFLTSVERIFDKSRPIGIYCRSGRRSEEAGHELASQGYVIGNLEGGILEWVKMSMPVVR